MFYPLRRKNLNRHFQLFALSAVLTIVVVRSFLFLTGYPQIGGGETGLHIAHMLWGGLLMLVAIMLDIFFIDPRLFNLRVLISGIGFGLFIDELGKFVTADNDYFFKPTFSIVYILFVLLVIVAKRIENRTHFSAEENEANNFFKEESYLNIFAPRLSRLLDKVSTSNFFQLFIFGLALIEIAKAIFTVIAIGTVFYSDQLIILAEGLTLAAISLISGVICLLFILGITGIIHSSNRLKRNLWRASILSLGTTQVIIFSASNLAGLIFLTMGIVFYVLAGLQQLKSSKA